MRASDASTDALLDAATSTASQLNKADLGNAELFSKQHRDKLKYCHSLGGWFIWSGKHWRADPDDQIMAYAEETADSLVSEIALAKTSEAQSAGLRHYTSAHRRTSLRAMIDLARHKLAVSADIFDTDPFAVNCSNGTIDCRTGKLKPHDPNDLITKLNEIEYDPKASAPRWQNFLAEILPDKSVRSYVQRSIGYSLTADQRAQCFFIAIGPGANGKGVFFKTIRAAVGPYGTSARPELLVRKRFESTNNEDVACLRGQRLVEVSETGNAHELNEEQVKNLTGEDFITASLKYQSLKGTEFTPTHTIWLRTNKKPTIRSTDPAMWRRPKLISFGVEFIEESKYRAAGRDGDNKRRINDGTLRILDASLSDVLRAELQGVLAWAIKGAVSWWNKGKPDLREPKIVTDAVNRYRSDSDILAQFVDECCERAAEVTTPLKRIYADYKKWATEKGLKPWSDRSLSSQLATAGFEMSHAKTGSQCTGLKLKPSAEENTTSDLEKKTKRGFNP